MEVIPRLDDTINVSECDSKDMTKEDDIRVRRPPNAFMLFGKEYRKVLAQKFEDFSNKQISKILGDEWKKMDINTKDYYHKLADEVHRKHLEKHPGYYYSPLEARQRKAERKLKSKMSRSNGKSNRSLQLDYPVVETFGGNRNFVYQNSMHPMMRPMFGTPIPPRVRFGQPILRYGPSHPFGGFVRFGRFGFPPSSPQLVVPINAEHSYAAQPRTHQSVQQTIKFEVNYESQPNEVQTETENEDNIETTAQTTDIELLANYLPPMHNPNIEVTQVLPNQFRSTEVDSNEVTESEAEVTKMSNASVDSELVLAEDVKQELIDEEVEDEKVVVECDEH